MLMSKAPVELDSPLTGQCKMASVMTVSADELAAPLAWAERKS